MGDFLLNLFFLVVIMIIITVVSAGSYFFITWQLPSTTDPLVHYPEVLRTTLVITGLAWLLQIISQALPEEDEE